MGMQEYNDGSLGDVKEIKDLKDAFSMVEAADVLKLHIAKKEELEKAKENIEKAEGKQLDRIENMLTSIILHFDVPVKGIIQLHNPKD